MDFQLTVEIPKPIGPVDEWRLLEAAVTKSLVPLPLRERLAVLRYGRDMFDEAIDLLVHLLEEAPTFDTANLLGLCHLSQETATGNGSALIAAEQAVRLAKNPGERAAALALLGKSQTRLGRVEAARRSFVDSLEADPMNRDAYKRLCALMLEADGPRAVYDLAERLGECGVGHPRLLASRVVALACMGRAEAAKNALDLDRFLYRHRLAAPSGWSSINAFNADLVAELQSHAELRFDRYGTASSKTWRIDHPATSRSQLVPRLQAKIVEAVHAYLARLPRFGNPWLPARPNRAILHSWCVMVDGDGFEEWHVHQHGWLSGVYYAAVPDAVASGSGRDGCILFGLPPDFVGEEQAAAFGETLVRPFGGLLMLFPSHSYHRTFPHCLDRRRVCFAFDVRPLD